MARCLKNLAFILALLLYGCAFEEFLREARKLEDSGKYAPALIFYNKALEKCPHKKKSKEEIWTDLSRVNEKLANQCEKEGNALELKGKWEEAYKSYTNALHSWEEACKWRKKVDPTSRPLSEHKTYLRLRRRTADFCERVGDEFRNQFKSMQANKWYQSAEELDGRDLSKKNSEVLSRDYLSQARTLRGKGYIEDALDMANRSLELNSSITAINLKAELEDLLSEAEQFYEKAQSAFKKKEYADSLKSLSDALEVYPQYSKALELRQRIQKRQTNSEKLTDEAQKALDEKKFKVAIALSKEALIDPSNRRAIQIHEYAERLLKEAQDSYNQAVRLADTGKRSKALESINQVLETYPYYEEARQKRKELNEALAQELISQASDMASQGSQYFGKALYFYHQAIGIAPEGGLSKRKTAQGINDLENEIWNDVVRRTKEKYTADVTPLPGYIHPHKAREVSKVIVIPFKRLHSRQSNVESFLAKIIQSRHIGKLFAKTLKESRRYGSVILQSQDKRNFSSHRLSPPQGVIEGTFKINAIKQSSHLSRWRVLLEASLKLLPDENLLFHTEECQESGELEIFDKQKKSSGILGIPLPIFGASYEMVVKRNQSIIVTKMLEEAEKKLAGKFIPKVKLRSWNVERRGRLQHELDAIKNEIGLPDASFQNLMRRVPDAHFDEPL